MSHVKNHVYIKPRQKKRGFEAKKREEICLNSNLFWRNFFFLTNKQPCSFLLIKDVLGWDCPIRTFCCTTSLLKKALFNSYARYSLVSFNKLSSWSGIKVAKIQNGTSQTKHQVGCIIGSMVQNKFITLWQHKLLDQSRSVILSRVSSSKYQYHLLHPRCSICCLVLCTLYSQFFSNCSQDQFVPNDTAIFWLWVLSLVQVSCHL